MSYNLYEFEVAWADPNDPDRQHWSTTFLSQCDDDQAASFDHDEAAKYAAGMWFRNLHTTLAGIPDNRVVMGDKVHVRGADYCYLVDNETRLDIAPYRFVAIVDGFTA